MKKSKAAIAAGILGIVYTIYLIVYFGGSTFSATDGAEIVGGAIASVIVMPHMIVMAIGSIFALVGAFINKAGFMLTASILFCVAAVLFFMYALFVVPMIVLGFVGYSRVKKIKAQSL